MKDQRLRNGVVGLVLGGAVMLLLHGCAESSDNLSEAVPRNPKEAASQLEQVFEAAAPEIKQNVSVAAGALQQNDYEKAVVSLQVLRNGKNITLDQGLAIHNSEIALRRKILSAMEAGDENAKRAFRLLRELSRD
jgi:hypothetical protein